MSQALQEERFRSERLEEQVNDLTELHQNEVENLKQTITDMEEKVQYQSEERLRDIHEMLESCQTKVWTILQNWDSSVIQSSLQEVLLFKHVANFRFYVKRRQLSSLFNIHL
jgi:hypothetical protein